MNLRSISRFTIFASTALLTACPGRAGAQQAERNGTYGVATLKLASVRNSGATFAGGRGGWIVNGAYGIGIGGYWLVNDLAARAPDTSGSSQMMVSYGGLDLEYYFPLDSTFHVSAQALMGGGAVGYTEAHYTNPRPHYDPFIVFEPGVNFEVGFGKTFRFVVGGSYRLVSRLSSRAATNGDLSGLAFGISVKAGFF